jgi:DNA-binding transcriptional regulator YdaS (Cro superfamily)
MGSFHQWFVGRADHKRPVIPAPYSIPAIIARAGKHGLTVQELAQVVRIDWTLLTPLLFTMASVGLIARNDEGDKTVYRAISPHRSD